MSGRAGKLNKCNRSHLSSAGAALGGQLPDAARGSMEEECVEKFS